MSFVEAHRRRGLPFQQVDDGPNLQALQIVSSEKVMRIRTGSFLTRSAPTEAILVLWASIEHAVTTPSCAPKLVAGDSVQIELLF